jgi:error-prone DNA polymerase
MGIADIPAEDPATYEMIRRADTIGVFQIESRAQMAMLPRLQPERFYDLVIEVAIVRPGPIQGDMVHPYLRRRQGLEAEDYPSEAVREVLARTLGVPIFQEQVIKLAMVAAGFSAGEADGLRRAMAAWRRRGGLEPYRQKLMQGMAQRGYARDFAERIYRQILGFGEYGFPESHAASFALLAYASAWLKCHHPAAFCAALLNSQPMGFYQPAQLVRDAREHGVTVLPVDVRHSGWDCSLEAVAGRPALRLGLRMVAGLSQAGAERVVRARDEGGLADVQGLASRAALERGDLSALAAADALQGLSGHRYQAAWQAAGVEQALPLFPLPAGDAQAAALSAPSLGHEVLADYAHLGLSLRAHPLALLRRHLRARGLLSADEVAERMPGEVVRTAGLVLIRQRPGEGKAVFVTVEDETGSQNLLVWADLAERQRRVLLGAGLLGVTAEIQRADGVQHLMCRSLEDHSDLLGRLTVRSRDFH